MGVGSSNIFDNIKNGKRQKMNKKGKMAQFTKFMILFIALIALFYISGAYSGQALKVSLRQVPTLFWAALGFIVLMLLLKNKK